METSISTCPVIFAARPIPPWGIASEPRSTSTRAIEMALSIRCLSGLDRGSRRIRKPKGTGWHWLRAAKKRSFATYHASFLLPLGPGTSLEPSTCSRAQPVDSWLEPAPTGRKPLLHRSMRRRTLLRMVAVLGLLFGDFAAPFGPTKAAKPRAFGESHQAPRLMSSPQSISRAITLRAAIYGCETDFGTTAPACATTRDPTASPDRAASAAEPPRNRVAR